MGAGSCRMEVCTYEQLMNAATTLGRVNAEFTDRVSCNNVTCNDLVLLFLLRQDLYPGAECGN